MELLDGADAPLEPLAGVPQIAHDETLLPPEANNQMKQHQTVFVQCLSEEFNITLLIEKRLLLKFMT